MKIDNFKLISIIGTSITNIRFRATIDITTGFIFKKKKTHVVACKYAGSWYFIETGKFTPGFEVEILSRDYSNKQEKDLHKCDLTP